MSSTPKPDRKATTLYIDRRLHLAARHTAFDRGETMSALIERAVARELGELPDHAPTGASIEAHASQETT